EHRINAFAKLGNAGLHAWHGLSLHHPTIPLMSRWIGVVFGLGFVLSFGYWTTNFAEVQRALSAKNLSAAQRKPLNGAGSDLRLDPVLLAQGSGTAVLPARRSHRHRCRDSRVDSHSVHRQGLLEHHELHPDAVLDFQRPAVRDIHRRDVLE